MAAAAESLLCRFAASAPTVGSAASPSRGMGGAGSGDWVGHRQPSAVFGQYSAGFPMVQRSESAGPVAPTVVQCDYAHRGDILGP